MNEQTKRLESANQGSRSFIFSAKALQQYARSEIAEAEKNLKCCSVKVRLSFLLPFIRPFFHTNSNHHHQQKARRQNSRILSLSCVDGFCVSVHLFGVFCRLTHRHSSSSQTTRRFASFSLLLFLSSEVKQFSPPPSSIQPPRLIPSSFPLFSFCRLPIPVRASISSVDQNSFLFLFLIIHTSHDISKDKTKREN